jgi:hypothetical protein
MAFAPQKLDTSRPRCHVATTFAQIVEQSILGHITEATTAEQFQNAQQSLILLCIELEQQADWRHYAAAGNLRHCCVRDIYTQAAFILKNLSLTQPAPPAPAPAPPPRETLADVVRDLKESVQPNPEATTLGTDEPMGEEQYPR